jgi:acetyl-CoA C-acetyltransferase
MEQSVIISAVRTPIGSFSGSLSSIPAPRLGSLVIKESLVRAGIRAEEVNEVIMGNVVSAGVGQAPARQAAIYAGLPATVGATTVNKVCGSGLKAVMMADQAIKLGDAQIVVAGGMESMSQTPYMLDKARGGYKMGHGTLVDLMIKDGLWDPYNDFHMGMCGELCAEKFGLTKEMQDEYAIQSYKKALKSQDMGYFNAEIVPVEVSAKRNETLTVKEDEDPKKGDLKKLPTLKSAFKKDGTITAGNAPSVNDGAAALVVTSAQKAKELGLTPVARIVGHAGAGHPPEWFTIAPADAVKNVLKKTGLNKNDINLWEINEAFSAVALANTKLLELDPATVNVNGGAVALGHPIGASGARILTTLLYAMKERRAQRGVAAICLGGGEAVAMVVELL